MKLSVVIPAHNEEGSIARDGRGGDGAPAGARTSPTRSSVVDDASRDRTAEVIARLAEADPNVRYVRSPYRNGFGFAVRAGLDVFEGDAVAIMMADLLRLPGRPRRLLPAARGRLRLRLRLALHARRAGRRLPAAQADDQPDRQPRHPRCSSATATTTRPTRSRPTGARSSTPSSRCSPPLQPHRRAAAEGRRARPLLRDRPDHAGATASRASPSCGSRRWAAATLFIVLYVFLEHHLSRGDYRRASPGDGEGRHRWRAGRPGAGSGVPHPASAEPGRRDPSWMRHPCGGCSAACASPPSATSSSPPSPSSR